MMLASAAKRWPLASPSAMQRATTVSNRWRSRLLSLKRPCRFLEKVEWSGTGGGQIEAAEPAVGEVEMDLFAQPTFRTETRPAWASDRWRHHTEL